MIVFFLDLFVRVYHLESHHQLNLKAALLLVVPLPVVLFCRLIGIFPSSNVSVLSEASKEEEEEELRIA